MTTTNPQPPKTDNALSAPRDTANTRCRICGGSVRAFLDLGSQPLSDAFLPPDTDDETTRYRFDLIVGACQECTMVQLLNEVPRDRMFHHEYPYLSSGSERMDAHFTDLAQRFLRSELIGDDPFFVELGCNDGVLMKTISDAGVRHLGIEPSGGVAELARDKGIDVLVDFFDHSVAKDIAEQHGQADLIYAANTLCHIPYMDSVLNGVAELLGPQGVFAFEDPYFADILDLTSFDQIYDEHFFYFTAESVAAMARKHGLQLVDVERLAVHGGEVRYWLAPAGARSVTLACDDLVRAERATALTSEETLDAFAVRVSEHAHDLLQLLNRLKVEGYRVVGYGATAKSATMLNYAGIGPDLLEFISDTSPTKHGSLTPGTGIPVEPSRRFGEPFPDYALLLAWNHADEIMAKEREYVSQGGRWITYVPKVEVR